jgi:CubicO group peptidase (beta-lactamase class C family)
MTKKSRKSVPTRTTLWVEALEQREVPAVAIAGGPYTIAEGQNLVLNASGSSNVGGGPLAYTWDVDGDGVYGDAIGVSPTVDWPLLNRLGVNDGPSSFNVRVRVNDTTFSPTAVNTLSNSYYQQNRIVLRGLGVIVGQGDRILFENYYGNYNANTQENIASGSKLVTSVTMMRLVNQGLMSLDAPISTYLPDLTWNPTTKSTMTLRQLLSHTSGLTGNDANAVENAASLQAGAPLIASSLIALQSPPGTEFDYGSNGYRLAAAAAERVTGLSWASIVNQYTAVPLGMSISWNGGANTNPAGQSRLTAKSYSNMLQMLMNQGVYNGQQFLSNGLVEEITTIQPGSTNVHPGSFYQSTALGYGFGQWIQGVDPNGRATVLSHFGSNGFKGAWDRTRGLWYVALLRDANSLTDSAGFFVNLINQVNSQIDPVDVDSPPVTLSVADALPTAGISVASAAVRGESLNFTFTATDPSPIDRAANFTYQVDWNNDGVIDLTQTGGNNINVSYAYPQVGSFTPSVRVTDKDGGLSNWTSGAVNVTRSRTAVNPGTGLLDLMVGGTTQADFLVVAPTNFFQPQGSPSTISVSDFYNTSEGVDTFPSVTGRIIAYMQAGDDIFTTVNLTRPELLFGGDGNDTLFGSLFSDTINGGDGNDALVGSNDPSTLGDMLNGDSGDDIFFASDGNNTINGGDGSDAVIGGAGNDIINGGDGDDALFGMDGNDSIVGGSGDDFIVGMAGADTIFGGTGSDLLIAGVLLDDPEESVDGIVLEWWSGDTYTNRVGRLRGTQGGGQNAYPLTVNGNVLDDQAVDQLYGEADLDFFYFEVNSDIAPDVAPGEVAIDL